MKKTLILLFLLAAGPVFAGSLTTNEDIKKIEDETQNCIDTNYKTDYGMMMCVIEGEKKYKHEIEKTIEGAKDVLSKTEYKELVKSQKRWEGFMTQHNTLLKQTYEKNCPPYLPCLTAASDKYEYVKTRIKDLSGFLWLYAFYKQNGVLDDSLNFQKLDK